MQEELFSAEYTDLNQFSHIEQEGENQEYHVFWLDLINKEEYEEYKEVKDDGSQFLSLVLNKASILGLEVTTDGWVTFHTDDLLKSVNEFLAAKTPKP